MLDNGSSLPDIVGRDLEGNEVSLDGFTDGSWAAVLFYRGHW